MLALCKSSNWNTSKHWIARLNSSSSKWIYVYIDGRKGKLCKITATHTSISINRIPMHAKIEIFFYPISYLAKIIQDHWTNTKGFSPFVRYDIQFYFLIALVFVFISIFIVCPSNVSMFFVLYEVSCLNGQYLSGVDCLWQKKIKINFIYIVWA